MKGFEMKHKCDKCGKELKNRGGLGQHKKNCNLTDEIKKRIKKMYFDDKLSINEIIKKGHKRNHIDFVLSGITRSKSQASKLAHKKYPKKFKFSEETKQKMRKKRLEYLKKHPFENAWRRTNLSYIEKLFQNLINKNNLSKKYDIIREYCEFPFYIDFAFLNIKLAVEIDGSQHWRNEENKKRDIRKNCFLTKKGWRVYRVPSFKLKNDFLNTEIDFISYLKNIDFKPKIFIYEKEILHYSFIKDKKREKIEDRKQERLKKQIKKFKDRKKVLEKIDLTKRGWLSKLSKLWKISHSQAKRYLHSRFPNEYKKVYS